MIVKIFCRYTAWYEFELTKTAALLTVLTLNNASIELKITVLLESLLESINEQCACE